MAGLSKNSLLPSHDGPVVAAMFNTQFHQVVSGSQEGTITLWDPSSGHKIFQFHKPHGNLEVTSICFDKSGRRLLTGSRDKYIRIWNFNNGQILRKLRKPSEVETTDICVFEMVVCLTRDRSDAL
jgi:WD40 repeat protein